MYDGLWVAWLDFQNSAAVEGTVLSGIMRTALNIDARILEEVKAIHQREGRPMGAVVSELLADALARRRAPRARSAFRWISRPVNCRLARVMLALAALALTIPLHFEPNRGQAEPQARYVAVASQYMLVLSDTDVAMQFPRGGSLRMNIPRTVPEAADPLPGRTNYYLTSDPAVWRTGIPNYARVRYRSAFRGVDLVVYGDPQEIEYDWVVAAGADSSAIRFSCTGASHMRVDANGDMVLEAAGREIRHRKPCIYQVLDGRRREIQGGFVLAHNGVRFRVGAYDKRRTLVIDPKLVYSTGFRRQRGDWRNELLPMGG